LLQTLGVQQGATSVHSFRGAVLLCLTAQTQNNITNAIPEIAEHTVRNSFDLMVETCRIKSVNAEQNPSAVAQ
jgi:hypothetical protein